MSPLPDLTRKKGVKENLKVKTMDFKVTCYLIDNGQQDAKN